MVHEVQLPEVRIQPDWNVELELHSLGRELPTSSFWTSYKDATTKTNDSINVASKGHLQLSPSDKSPLQVSKFDDKLKKWIILQGPNNSFFKFQSPSQMFKDLHGAKMPIHNIDLSPQGELVTTCSDNGSLLVWETSNGSIRRELKGHVGDVLVSKFFPSGQVIISSGSDRQIKIWNLLDGVCAATLKGHSLGVTSLDFVDRGRNFITSSRDGSVRLWETSTQSNVSVLYSSTNPINDCKLCTSKFEIPSERQPDSREYGTDGKLALIACENGKFVGVDLRSNKSAFEVECGSPVNTCTPLSESQYLVGLDNGKILQWDSTNLKEPTTSFSKNSIPVLRLLKHNDKEAWVTTKDGQCYLLDTQNNKVEIELVGADIDPIEAIAVNKGLVITGSRDSIIRKYNIA